MEVRPAAWVFARDVAAVESFLREVLGFTGWTRTVGDDSRPGVVVLERDGFEITLFCAENVSPAPIQRAVITFLVEDLEPYAGLLDHHGIRYHWLADAGERPSITFDQPADLRAFALEQFSGPSTSVTSRRAGKPPDPSSVAR
jgi:catechol 2,3-dioxygenase-like lactoylglutathione lyase family enzyme